MHAEYLYTNFDTNIRHLIDKHAPIITKTITLRPETPYYSDELRRAKCSQRKLERKWRKTNIAIDRQLYMSECSFVNSLLRRANMEYFSQRIVECGRDQRAIHKMTNKLLQKVYSKTTIPRTQSPRTTIPRDISPMTTKSGALLDQ